MEFLKKINGLSRRAKVLFLVGVLCLLLAGAAAVGIHKVRSVDGFLSGTTLNGEDISGKTAGEVAGGIRNQLADARVELTENGSVVLTGSLADFGHGFEEHAFEEALTEEEYQQKHSLSATLLRLVDSAGFELTDYYEDDAQQLATFVVSSDFQIPRVKSEQAHLELNEEKELYEVIPPVQGNELDDKKLQDYVDKILDGAVQNGTFLENPLLQIRIPEDVYTSEIVSTDTAELEKEAREKNRQLLIDAYRDVTITYTFGSQTEVLEGDTIADWVKVDDKMKVTLDEDKVAEYVSGLADQYETRYRDRYFTASDGRSIYFSPAVNEYGYTINEAAEADQLAEEILARESVTREPVYYDYNIYGNPLYYARDGADDLAGTYVEVSISSQHLWYYRDYTLLIESDVVTGNTGSKETQTMTGCYPLAYKDSPATLKGENSDDKWSSEVDYWMAFNQGQGLHDAPWRSEFGGNIYKTNGSHGCVNLPPSVAAYIYENIVPGTAIIVYE